MLKAVVFDMDGVLYRGATGIPGVAGEIRRLRKRVKVLFLTRMPQPATLRLALKLIFMWIGALPPI